MFIQAGNRIINHDNLASLVGGFHGAFSIIMSALVSLRRGSLYDVPLGGASGYPAIAYTLDPMGNRVKEQVLDSSGALSRQTSRVIDVLNRLQPLRSLVRLC